MRGWMAAAVLASLTGAAVAEGPRVMVKAVDLNAPGALEELHRADPTRFGDVVSILQRAESATEEEFERAVKAHSNGSAGYMHGYVRTTYPPQREFSFRLGETTYSGRTTLALRAALMGAGVLPDPAVPREAARKAVPRR
jgi:hypothetical protein